MEPTPDVKVKNIQNFLSLHYVVFKIASDVLRKKFSEKWKAIFDSEWTNSQENAKSFIEGAGKSVFFSSKKIQKNLLKTGNIQGWDLPLLIDSIKCLENFANSCKSDDVVDEHKKLNDLKEIRNQLSHQPTTEVVEANFAKYWQAACQILISFGVTQQTLDEAKNVKFTESPTFSENVTPTNEPNSTKADELKEKGNKYYAAKQYKEAIDVYSEAIELPGIPLKTLAFLYSNRSLMYLKLNDLSNAKDDANGVIHMNPSWWRGYARLAESYEKSNKFEKAIKNYELALQMNPPDVHNKTLTESLYYCRRRLGKINRMESKQPHNFINSVKEMIDDANKQLGRTGTPLDEATYYNCDSLINKIEVLKSDPGICCAEGHKFLRGIGVPQDFELAANRFAKAASKGSADGMYNLGILLLEGKGIKRNAQEGISMWNTAAAQPSFILHGEQKVKLMNEGVSEAKHALGLAYYEGSGVPKNIKTAFLWWSRAVEDGNGASANNIGIMYEEGEFVSADIERALLYWKFAAFDGLVRAMENLCRVYMNKRNYIEAFDWYRLAVENGSLKDAQLEKFIAERHRSSGKFDSKRFVDKLTEELKESSFRNIVLRCQQINESMAQTSILNDVAQVAEEVARIPKNNAAFIVEHRTFFKEFRDIAQKEKRRVAVSNYYVHPPKLHSKLNVDVIGLKQIHFKDMDVDVDKIYEGFAVKFVIIDDAIIGQPSVNVIGQDENGSYQRIFIYNIPQNEETQDKVGYGCTLTIVNPYHRIGAVDGRPMIRVDNPSTVLYHTALTNKKRCRYCGNPQGIISCRKCQRAYYCSQNCLSLDSSKYQHKLVCVKKL